MRVDEILSKGFHLYKKQFVAFIIATLIAVIGSVFIITAPPLFFGLYYMSLKLIRGEEVEIKDVFRGFDYFFVSWILVIIAGFAILAGLIFFILPGLLLMIMFQYAIPIAINEDSGAVESLRKSYGIAYRHLEFSIIIGIVLLVFNAIGSSVSVGGLITFPYTVICISIATLELMKNGEYSGQHEIQGVLT